MPWGMDGAGTVVAQKQLVTPCGVRHPLETRCDWVELNKENKEMNKFDALAIDERFQVTILEKYNAVNMFSDLKSLMNARFLLQFRS